MPCAGTANCGMEICLLRGYEVLFSQRRKERRANKIYNCLIIFKMLLFASSALSAVELISGLLLRK